jgi:hypothetical protein
LGAVRWIWIGSLAAAALAAAAVVAIAHGDSSGRGGTAPAANVHASLDHTAVDFADPVTATVTVTAPGKAAVRVEQDLAPLTQLGPARVTRVARGGTQTVTYAARGSCLDDRCLATLGAKRVALRPATVIVGRRTTTAKWPILNVQRRVSAADAAQTRPPLRSDTAPPPVTYRVSPDRLGTVLEVVAALLAAAGVLLAGATATAIYRRRQTPEPLTGLERALALARDAERRPAPDRRRALELLARLLGPRDPGLADDAEQLAWSERAPTPVALEDLVVEVEEKVR